MNGNTNLDEPDGAPPPAQQGRRGTVNRRGPRPTVSLASLYGVKNG